MDVKSSKDISKLLKEVSKDKLVIVVTHNPEYFKDYATRRVRIFDGRVSENKKVAEVEAAKLEKDEIEKKRSHNIKNTLWIGFLNYRSRPKFTMLMTCAMIICALSLFVILENYIFIEVMILLIVEIVAYRFNKSNQIKIRIKDILFILLVISLSALLVWSVNYL